MSKERQRPLMVEMADDLIRRGIMKGDERYSYIRGGLTMEDMFRRLLKYYDDSVNFTRSLGYNTAPHDENGFYDPIYPDGDSDE